MKTKIIAVFIIVLFVTGTAFSQAHNTVTVDIGPFIVGSAMADAIGLILEEEGGRSSGFGIGLQYERELLRFLSVAGRFAYLGFGMGFTFTDQGVTANADTDFSSFSIEGHARFYPQRNQVLFLDGMLGYANMAWGIRGDVIATDDYGNSYREAMRSSFYEHFIKYGAKVGWRFRFGNKKGFTFEPALGYSGGIRVGDSIGNKFAKAIGGDSNDAKEFDELLEVLSSVIFVGGPRLSLGFGWSF